MLALPNQLSLFPQALSVGQLTFPNISIPQPYDFEETIDFTQAEIGAAPVSDESTNYYLCHTYGIMCPKPRTDGGGDFNSYLSGELFGFAGMLKTMALTIFAAALILLGAYLMTKQ